MKDIFGRSTQGAWANGRSFSAEEAALVKGMLARGDRQSDIAAYFNGINQGRVADIATGRKFPEVPQADPASLPEPGSFFSLMDRASLVDMTDRLRELINRLTHVLQSLEKLIPQRPVILDKTGVQLGGRRDSALSASITCLS